MPLVKIDPKITTRVRQALDEVGRTHGLKYRSVLDSARTTIEELPGDVRVPALQKATGKGIRRWRAAASVVGHCAPSPQLDEWVLAALRDPDSERRDWILQIIGNNHLVRFAPEVDRIIEEDSECREFAIMAAGELGTPSNCAALVSHAASLGADNIEMNLLQALSKFKSAIVTPFLQRAFEADSEEDYRVFAAWGLGRQGDRKAIQYLVDMLDDQNGSARRAAQALSDLFDWSLDWVPEAPAQAKERWRERKNERSASKHPKPLSRSAMTKVYGVFHKRSAHMNIVRENVPASVSRLIPYAEFWGVRDDGERVDLIEAAPAEVLRDLAMAVRSCLNDLEGWLSSSHPVHPSEEYVAFSNLLIAFHDPRVGGTY